MDTSVITHPASEETSAPGGSQPVANYGLPEWLRVTVGTAAENARFLAALAGALAR